MYGQSTANEEWIDMKLDQREIDLIVELIAVELELRTKLSQDVRDLAVVGITQLLNYLKTRAEA